MGNGIRICIGFAGNSSSSHTSLSLALRDISDVCEGDYWDPDCSKILPSQDEMFWPDQTDNENSVQESKF